MGSAAQPSVWSHGFVTKTDRLTGHKLENKFYPALGVFC